MDTRQPPLDWPGKRAGVYSPTWDETDPTHYPHRARHRAPETIPTTAPPYRLDRHSPDGPGD